MVFHLKDKNALALELKYGAIRSREYGYECSYQYVVHWS